MKMFIINCQWLFGFPCIQFPNCLIIFGGIIFVMLSLLVHRQRVSLLALSGVSLGL